MMNCRDCSSSVSLRDAMCPRCGRFLIADRPPEYQRERSAVVVIVIALVLDLIALVTSVTYREARQYQGHAIRAQAQNDVRAIHPAAEKWRAEHLNECPTMEILQRDEEISRSSKITDPWDSPYRIDCTANETFVRSYGRDRKRGTADDIVVPYGPEMRV